MISSLRKLVPLLLVNEVIEQSSMEVANVITYQD